MDETPQERVDELTDEQCRQVLLRIVESIEANGHTDGVVAMLAEWSLIDPPAGGDE